MRGAGGTAETEPCWSPFSQSSPYTCAPVPSPNPPWLPKSQCLASRPPRGSTSLAGLNPATLTWSPTLGQIYFLQKALGDPNPKPPLPYLACCASHHHLGCVLAQGHLLYTKPRVITVGIKAAHLGGRMEE